ncbi:MAG: lipoyl(octanoyl) transferase LipB [Bacteroidota bacterium]
MENVTFKDLGRIDFQRAWDYQTSLHQQLIARKRDNRLREKAGEPLERQEHYLLFCEHTPVYTLGKSGSLDHLLLDEPSLKAKGFSFYKINRGGDITYHGPGQLVGYPIFDLDHFFTDVHRYVAYLEEAVITLLEQYGIEGKREEGFRGVWLAATDMLPKRKICAIGVHLSRWVTLHGFALNVNTDLGHFRNIVPCGIDAADKDVTSMQAELGQEVDFEQIKQELKSIYAGLFDFQYK